MFTETAQKKRTKLALVEESTYGVVPSGPPTLQDLLETNDGLKTSPEYARSNYRRSDRNRPGSFLAGSAAAGQIGIQLPYGHYDDLLASLFFAASWAAEEEHIAAATTISFQSIATSSSSYAKILDSGNGLASYDAGGVIEVTGASDNNGVYKIQSVAAGEIEIVDQDLTDESAGDSVTITQFANITNGTSARSWAVERHYTDLTTSASFAHFPGVVFNTGELTIQPKQLIQGNFGVIAKPENNNSATIGDGSNTAVPTDISMNAVQHIGAVLVGGLSLNIRQITLRIDNGIEPMDRVGLLGPFDYSEGDFALSGELQVYLNSGSTSATTEFAKSIAGTASSLWVPFSDTAGNQYVIDIPTLKYSDSDRSPGDSSPGGVIARLPFEAEVTTAESMTARWARRAA